MSEITPRAERAEEARKHHERQLRNRVRPLILDAFRLFGGTEEELLAIYDELNEPYKTHFVETIINLLVHSIGNVVTRSPENHFQSLYSAVIVANAQACEGFYSEYDEDNGQRLEAIRRTLAEHRALPELHPKTAD